MSEFNPQIEGYRTSKLVTFMFYHFLLGVASRSQGSASLFDWVSINRVLIPNCSGEVFQINFDSILADIEYHLLYKQHNGMYTLRGLLGTKLIND